MKASETYNEMKARTIQLRKDVVATVKEHGRLSSHRIARLLNISNMSISSICVGLVNAGYLDYGTPSKSESKNSHTVLTYVAGPNQNPIPNEYKLIKKSYYQPRPKVERDPIQVQQVKAEMITEEDLAWMKKYRLQRQQRYARFGELAPA